jgi:hypothetical protein
MKAAFFKRSDFEAAVSGVNQVEIVPDTHMGNSKLIGKPTWVGKPAPCGRGECRVVGASRICTLLEYLKRGTISKRGAPNLPYKEGFTWCT